MRMTRLCKYLIASILPIMFIGCIDNDIPYPIVKLDILTFEVEGAKTASVIDPVAHSVTFELEETTDIRNVNVTSVTMTEGARSDVEFPGIFDMREPLYVTLSKYQDYEWTITAEQTIERYFRVEGQIGEAQIDPVSHIATAFVPMDKDLSDIVVTAAKFGPEGITSYSPDPFSFTSFEDTVHHVLVSYHGDIEEMWTLCVVPTEVEVEFNTVDAWAKRIWLTASGRSGSDLGFMYRLSGTEEWTVVEDVEIEGGNFKACIADLEPLTTYDVVAYSGENLTDVVSVTTEDIFVLFNSGMEDWSFADKSYFPYAEGAAPFWGTGNPGATTLGEAFNLTTPTTDTRPGTLGAKAADLQSMFPSMAGIGKFAAGNLFTGRFAGTFGTNGVVHFGRPSTARPVALRCWIKYEQGMVDKIGKVPADTPDLKIGDPDQGSVYIAVGDWTAEEYGGDAESPVAIDTRDEGTFFNPRGKNVIGYGGVTLTESTDGWVELTIPLEYVSTSRIPTHIVVVFSGSRWGDYFTGSTHSHMVVDDIELLY